MSAVFVTSDPHVFHELMARLRGFVTPDGRPDVAAHNAWYMDMWRSQVTKRDTVYVLGDLTVGGTAKEAAALNLIASLPGRKIFVSGNHDRVHPAHRDSIRRDVNEAWLSVFDSAQPFALRRMSVAGVRRHVRMSHFPLFGDHTREDRFDQWRLRDDGNWLLHGHTHKPGQRVHDGNQIHVGIDAWGRLLPQEDVVELISAREAGQLRQHIESDGSGAYVTPKGPIPFTTMISAADAEDAD